MCIIYCSVRFYGNPWRHSLQWWKTGKHEKVVAVENLVHHVHLIWTFFISLIVFVPRTFCGIKWLNNIFLHYSGLQLNIHLWSIKLFTLFNYFLTKQYGVSIQSNCLDNTSNEWSHHRVCLRNERVGILSKCSINCYSAWEPI